MLKAFLPFFIISGTSLFAATAPARLEFKTAGFSIEALEPETPSDSVTPVMMTLPPRDGFAPNVNVVIQPWKEGIDGYVVLSKKQFESMHFTVISSVKSTPSSATLEYKGNLPQGALHFYSRAISTGDKVYLVTATALETNWPADSTKLKRCVDSFTLPTAKR